MGQGKLCPLHGQFGKGFLFRVSHLGTGGAKAYQEAVAGARNVLEVEASGFPCQPPLSVGPTSSVSLGFPGTPCVITARRAETSLQPRHWRKGTQARAGVQGCLRAVRG